MDVTVHVDEAGAARSLHRWLENEIAFGSGRMELRGNSVHLVLDPLVTAAQVASMLHRWQITRRDHPAVIVEVGESKVRVEMGDPDAETKLERAIG
jgi:hypothetical protein